MKWIEAKVIYESADPDLTGELISLIFYDMGLKGVSMEEPGMTPEEGWGDDAVIQPSHYAVAGFFPAAELTDSRKETLFSNLHDLARKQEIVTQVVFREMDEEDWAESWKAYFQPEKITDRIVIKPTWRNYKPADQELVIEIDPGMAFGTGTHPTTSLCIQLIETYLKPGATFLDIGTGSGILMVTAAKLGAGKVWGIDNDPVAVAVAEKNLQLNRTPSSRFRLFNGNLVDRVGEPFQLITANILSEVILDLLDQIQPVVRPGSILICSGIIEENAPAIQTKIKAIGLDILEIQEREQWVAIVAAVPLRLQE